MFALQEPDALAYKRKFLQCNSLAPRRKTKPINLMGTSDPSTQHPETRIAIFSPCVGSSQDKHRLLSAHYRKPFFRRTRVFFGGLLLDELCPSSLPSVRQFTARSADPQNLLFLPGSQGQPLWEHMGSYDTDKGFLLNIDTHPPIKLK
ncbi:hypothetical protein C0Q70_14947 [Pomacea canaliculata]|uniref:Uncharacterized protein n=1 Tax=Pomacea canaliculata TaxID=400727 RepID=A0A2T7NTH7_POMCA|nr:hypothetical protein C0Q70_14947 [Pomacea canaliculata]